MDFESTRSSELKALFQKSEALLEKEFNDIERVPVPPRSNLRKTKITIPGHEFFSADRCVDDTLILSQAPTKEGYDAFRQIVYNDADAIITLMQEFDYKTDRKLYPYFNPSIADSTLSHSDIEWKLGPQPIIQSTLEFTPIQGQGPAKQIPHFHYNNWHDGCGLEAADLASLARVAMRFKRPLIHCKAGVGRSGTLAVLISAYRKILEGDFSSDVVQRATSSLRLERYGAVHSSAQYVAIHEALKILLQDRLL